MNPLFLSVIIPTYNEKENIIALIHAVITELRLSGKRFEIVIVDDNSPDGTGTYVRRVFRRDSRVRLYIRKKSPGLGASILYGVRKARGDIIVGMDADFNHDPRVIGRLIAELDRADLVVASRFVPGGGMDNTFRFVTSLCFNMLLRVVFGFPIRDNTSGFYALRRNTLLSLSPEAIYYGYGEYHLRLTYAAYKNHFRITETPVYYRSRIYGQSKSRFFTMVASYLHTAYCVRFC